MRHGGAHSAVPGRVRADHRSSRPAASQGPRPGYGEGRGQYYAPKGELLRTFLTKHTLYIYHN